MFKLNLILLVIVVIFVESCLPVEFTKYSPFRRKKFVEDNGYPFEVHTITTTDGYIIDIDRIPYGHMSPLQPNVKKPVVLIQSVGCSDSSVWLAMGPNRSLAFVLADHGFDVWIGNHRGSTFGRKHVTLNPNKDRDFWDFSQYEHGIYDLRNTVDFILNKTSQSNLTYISHSMGAADFLILVSEMPEYNSKFKLSVLYGPAVYLKGGNTFFADVFKLYDLLEFFLVFFNVNELFTYSEFGRQVLTFLCHQKSILYRLCSCVFSRSVGATGYKYDFPLISSAYPGGLSAKQVLTFAQHFNNDRFARYDYGKEDNIYAYGQDTPPTYPISNVKVPVVFYRGAQDYMTSYKNVEKLAIQLPNTVALFNVSNFDHASFLWGKDLAASVYLHTINIIQSV